MTKYTCLISAIAIIVLGGLEMFALSKGIDGILFTTVAAIIGGIAGYTVKTKVGVK